MSNNYKDFNKFALSKGISSLAIDRFNKHQSIQGIVNPYIVEERTGNPLQIDIFSKLFTDRILVLGSEVNPDTANILNCQLLYMRQDNPNSPVSLWINSPGGTIYDGLSIYDMMQYIEPPVYTTCMGLAASMASIILCAGEHGNRKSLIHSRVMIHQPMSGLQAGTQASDFEIANKEIQILKKELFEILAEHTGKDYNELINLGDRDCWLTAQEAKDLNIIDEVITKM
jgi:ATP-dependent Clp protease protease subunit